MTIQQAIARLVDRASLSRAEMQAAMREIMTGAATPAQIAGFLVALRMKGETLDEITGAVEVMRELCTPVQVGGDHLVDIVGTGGDGAGCSMSPPRAPSWWRCAAAGWSSTATGA